jgi:putative endonuclease
LKRHGYRILETNYRTRLGEIDVIAEDKRTVVFVEVKMRSDDRFGGPAAAITPAKQVRLARLARQFLTSRRLGERLCRFDAILIYGDDPAAPRLELITAAFEVSSNVGHRASA